MTQKRTCGHKWVHLNENPKPVQTLKRPSLTGGAYFRLDYTDKTRGAKMAIPPYLMGVPWGAILDPPKIQIHVYMFGSTSSRKWLSLESQNGSNLSERVLNVQMALMAPQKVPLVLCV